jgi:nucleoside-diphosphate-sugar epimerase
MAGKQARVVRVPRGLVLTAGKLSEVALRLVGRTSPLSIYRLRSALACRCFDSTRAGELLGWQPGVGVRAGIGQILNSESGISPAAPSSQPTFWTPTEVAVQSD